MRGGGECTGAEGRAGRGGAGGKEGRVPAREQGGLEVSTREESSSPSQGAGRSQEALREGHNEARSAKERLQSCIKGRVDLLGAYYVPGTVQDALYTLPH